jgi:hypothetical protein
LVTVIYNPPPDPAFGVRARTLLLAEAACHPN